MSSNNENRSTSFQVKHFLTTFCSTKGCLELVAICVCLAFAGSCVIGIVPNAIADRYARLHYNYTGELDCSELDLASKPLSCQQGTDNAQAAAAWSNLAVSILALTCNPVLGSVSDVQGRRYPIILSLILSSLSSFALLALLADSTLDPFWYFAASSLGGIANIFSLSFASLSDVLPPELRAPSFGVLMASVSAGFALAPSLPLVITDSFQVALTSTALKAVPILLALFVLPETLPEKPDVWLADDYGSMERDLLTPDDDLASNPLLGLEQPAQRQASLRRRNYDYATCCGICSNNSVIDDDDELEDTALPSHWIVEVMTRPFRDLSIINRDWTIRLLSIGMMLSAMVFASDITFFMYYAEDQLNVGAEDIAVMFLSVGLSGVILQGFLLHPLQLFFGEKGLLVFTFACGAVHNLLYGIARSKTTLFYALLLSTVTKLNFPILSSLASRDTDKTEQGRIQGALFAVNSIGYAVGPLTMEWVYHRTATNPKFGPGFMFLYAAVLYAIGTVIVSFIPNKKKNQQIGVLEPFLSDPLNATHSHHDDEDLTSGSGDVQMNP